MHSWINVSLERPKHRSKYKRRSFTMPIPTSALRLRGHLVYHRLAYGQQSAFCENYHGVALSRFSLGRFFHGLAWLGSFEERQGCPDIWGRRSLFDGHWSRAILNGADVRGSRTWADFHRGIARIALQERPLVRMSEGAKCVTGGWLIRQCTAPLSIPNDCFSGRRGVQTNYTDSRAVDDPVQADWIRFDTPLAHQRGPHLPP